MNLIRRNNPQDMWDPLNVISELQEEMNRLFSRSLTKPNGTNFQAPDVDLHEDEHQFALKADLPGIRKEELQISVTGTTLVLKGERKAESKNKENGRVYSERWFGSFERWIELPSEVDAGKIKASFKDGVLEMTIPKAETAKPKPIKVEIK